jgi:undecaprenyl-diphosphatase
MVGKLLGLDPRSPEMTMLLVMLHTGTMFAVIVYFWKSWKATYFASRSAAWRHAVPLVLSTALTAVVTLSIMALIKYGFLRNAPKGEIETLFGNLPLIALSLALVGLLILYAGRKSLAAAEAPDETIGTRDAAWIGAVQGLSVCFRGFSRSGATISTGMVLGGARRRIEEFSFALAVILTPPALVWEARRLVTSQGDTPRDMGSLAHLFLPGLLGLVCSFAAGLLALKWLSSWLERGRWHFFGFYCLFAAAVAMALHLAGY